MSSFLSPDNYMQDPTTQQGFNRYAYCMYNPLKYIDPSGEQYFGWNGNSSYADEQAERLVLRIRYNNYQESMQMTMERIDNFSNSLWSQGDSQGGAIGGNGCHGGGSNELESKIKEFCEKHGIEPGKAIPEKLRTDDFLKEFQETFFPNAPMDFVKHFLFKDMCQGIDGQTINIFDDNLFSTGYSDVCFNSNTDFTPEDLFYAMGHELIHVSQNIETMGYPQSMLIDPSFIDVKEFWAHSWISATGGIDHYPINATNMQLWSNHVNPLNHNETINYTNMMNYINFNWLNHIFHP